MSKNKIELTPDINVDELLVQLQKKYSDKEINTIDGVKIHFDNGWVHLRKSNTEPIIRIYAENTTKAKADELAQQIINDVEGMVRLV
jgi:phosphomannomutase